MDKDLFDKMVRLKKIYIQDPKAGQIKSTMENAFQVFQPEANLGLQKPIFQLENEVNKFVIPYEL